MKRNLLILFCLIAAVTSLHAQTRSVTGTVVDATNTPMIGTTVRVKGTNMGAITNMEGKYSLPKVSGDDTIEFLFLGYTTVSRKVGKLAVIDVVMQDDVKTLDEVVVVGYGTVRKSDLTGSVSVVKIDDKAALPAMSALDAMQGKVSGVQILTNTGEPGSGMTFNVRGTTSISGSNSPLIVLDGQPLNTGFGTTSAGVNMDWMSERPATDPMANINPNDIESIQILKDASSTAIYGSAGANGVVLITTKQGKQGRDVISYNGRIDVSYLPKKLGVASTEDYYTYLFEAQNWDNAIEPRFKTLEDALAASALQPNTNWQDLTYHTAISHEHQVSFSGGDKKTQYLISANYADQKSIVKNGGYQRMALRANVKRQLNKRLSISANNYLAMSDKSQIPQANSQGNLSTSVVLSALAFKPETVPFNEEGGLDEGLTNNPVVMRETMQDKTKVRTIITNVKLEYEILRGLKASINGGANSVYSIRNMYWPRTLYQGKVNDGSGTRADNDNFYYMLDYLLSFNRRFKKHNINAVAGYSWQEWTNTFSSSSSTGFPNDLLGYYGFASASYPGRLLNGENRRATSSFLTRINYSYDDRYVMVFTGRMDGSSRLAPGHKWGMFPSVGLAWNAHNEKFLKDVYPISTLKVRASYGTSGNESIGIGATQAKVGYNDAVFGTNSIQSSYLTTSFANPYLTWEQTRQINVGVDFGLWKNRVELSAEIYQKNTTDLLMTVKLPGSSSFINYSDNAGEVRNRGIDLEGKFRILTGKVKLNVAGNISVVRNEILSMGDVGIVYGRNYCDNGQFILNQPLHVARTGSSIGMFIGYKTDGIYQTQDEINANTWTNPETSQSNIIDPSARPGDVRWVDSNNDGKITVEDRTIIGSPFPDFTYGFSLDLSYKGFSFAATITGSQGNQIINFNQWVMGGLTTKTGTNIFKDAYDHRWTGEGTSNKYPRPSTGDVLSTRFPDWMVEDASYLRLQSVTLSYTLPKKVTKIGTLKVYASGTNLFTLTNYSGYDPAVNSFGAQALQPGVDFGTLPSPRVISAGLQVTF